MLQGGGGEGTKDLKLRRWANSLILQGGLKYRDILKGQLVGMGFDINDDVEALIASARIPFAFRDVEKVKHASTQIYEWLDRGELDQARLVPVHVSEGENGFVVVGPEPSIQTFEETSIEVPREQVQTDNVEVACNHLKQFLQKETLTEAETSICEPFGRRLDRYPDQREAILEEMENTARLMADVIQEGSSWNISRESSVPPPPDPDESTAKIPEPVLEYLVTQFQNFIPLRWSAQSCFMDSDAVVFLSDRNSPYFTAFKPYIQAFFRKIGRDVDDLAQKPFSLMDRDVLRVVNDSRIDGEGVRHNKQGLNGTLARIFTNGDIKAYELFQDGSVKDDVVCMQVPFLFESLDARTANREVYSGERTLNIDGISRTYTVHAISGRRGGHFETLVRRVITDADGRPQNVYFKINVTSSEIRVDQMSIRDFLDRYSQIRIYYIADTPLTEEEQRVFANACNSRIRKRLQQKLLIMLSPDTSYKAGRALILNSDVYKKDASLASILDKSQYTLTELLDEFRAALQTNPLHAEFIHFLTTNTYLDDDEPSSDELSEYVSVDSNDDSTD